MEDFKLLSSVDKLPDNCDPSTILCTIEGPFNDYSDECGNGYWYSAELWDKVLSEGNFDEFSTNTVNFGEGDHPADQEDRSHIKLTQVSHAYRDVVNDKANKMVRGKVDILDTPDGRILYTLIKYGARLGISARGEGDLVAKPGGGVMVDPETYKFFAFDLVHQPSSKIARLDMLIDRAKQVSGKVVESLKGPSRTKMIPLLESVQDNPEVLQKLSELMESPEYNDREELKNKITELQKDESNDDLVTQLKSDLKDLASRYTDLESKYQQLQKEFDDSKNTNSKLDSILDRLNQSQTTQSVDLAECIQRDDSQLFESMTDEILSRVEEVYTNLVEPLYHIKNNMSKVVRNHQAEKRIAEEYYDRILMRVDDTVDEIRAIPSSIKVDESSITYLTQQLDDARAEIGRLTSANRQLLKDLEVSNSERSRLSESLSSSKESRLKENRKYLQLRCNQLGLDARRIESQLSELDTMTSDDIDTYLARTYGQSESQIGGLVTPAGEVQTNNQLTSKLNESQRSQGTTPGNIEALKSVIMNNI